MKHIVTVGGATQDIFIDYENAQTMHLHSQQNTQSYLLLEEGAKIEVSNIGYAVGGGATNTGVSFRRQGFNVTPCYKPGDDEHAAFIAQRLSLEKLNLSHITPTTKMTTGRAFVIPCLSGDRTIMAYRGANALLDKQDIPQNIFTAADMFYITSLSGQSAQLLPWITEHAQKSSIPVAINPGVSQLKSDACCIEQSLKNIDIFIINSSEARTFMGTLAQKDSALQSKLGDLSSCNTQKTQPQLLSTPTLHKNIWFSVRMFMQEVLSRGPKIVIVTNGKEGVYVGHEKTLYFHPSLTVPVVNTIGAGDAFGSCFAGTWLITQSIETAIVRGIVNSASVIHYVDAQAGLLSRSDLEQQANTIGTSLLKTFDLSSTEIC